MKVTHIEARDLEEAWRLCLKEAYLNGREYIITRGSFVGHKRREIEFVIGHVMFPGSRPIIPVLPEGMPYPTDMDYVKSYKDRYLLSTEIQGNEQYTYGQDILPQLYPLIKMYTAPCEGCGGTGREDLTSPCPTCCGTGKQGFGTNQGTMTIGSRESINLSDPQCLRIIDTRVQDNKLHFFVYFRSWDLWAGFPSNLAGIQLVKEDLAKAIGVEDGELIFASKGLHLYDYHFDVVKNWLKL